MYHHDLSRRDFLHLLSRWGAVGAGAGFLLSHPRGLDLLDSILDVGPTGALASEGLDVLLETAPPARYWISTSRASCSRCHADEDPYRQGSFDHDTAYIQCELCAQQCQLAPGERGRCRARLNVDGELRSLVYGRPLSVHVDPIEKKPLYHFLPGREAFSMSTAGCPLSCKFCQNWEISQARPEDYDVEYVEPGRIVGTAARRGVPVIAFTYNEPTVFTEYLTDIARLARPRGHRCVLISCGFMQEAPLKEMCEVLDAIKIDLKGFDEDFYRRVCGAELKPVLRSIEQVARSGVHLELVNLVVPTLNDSDEMLTGLARWVVDHIGPDVPVHYTRFHPDFQLRNLPPTPIATLERARAIALEQGMHYAYVGNVPGHPGNHTYCPACGRQVIERQGFFILENEVQDGRCGFCDEPIAGVWS